MRAIRDRHKEAEPQRGRRHLSVRYEGIRIDSWNLPGTKIRACYFADGEPSVMVRKDLPREPKLFALVHELKHHYVDRESILNGEHRCGAYNENELIEKGADVFAASLYIQTAK